MSMKCRVMGHDLNDCGVCTRCKEDVKGTHDWQEADRAKKCFRREACSRCEAEREQPEHDWQMTDGALKCSRCGLAI